MDISAQIQLASARDAIDNTDVRTLEPPSLQEVAMASRTAASSVKRKNKHQKAGRRRKNRLARRSTQSMTELFAGLGEPGQPAPKG
jgi:hypothetical protein